LAYNNSDIFETSLLEGSVRICDLSTSQTVLLKPNERVQLKNGKFLASSLESEDDFLWSDGIYVFKNEPIATVFKKLEQYYQIQIIVRNTDILRHRCTGKFRQKEGIEHVFRVLQNANDFQYKRDEENNAIVIY
jgi:ferric-dicitrate binding protein FerR (iron transport regulator)